MKPYLDCCCIYSPANNTSPFLYMVSQDSRVWVIFILIRDCGQMTFVTLINQFCPLIKTHTTHPSPGKLSSNVKCKIHACFTQVHFQFSKVLIIKSYKISYTSHFISSCFTSVFTSVDIIFSNFSELDSKLSKTKKEIFVTNYPFFNRFIQNPDPLNNENLLIVTEIFC